MFKKQIQHVSVLFLFIVNATENFGEHSFIVYSQHSNDEIRVGNFSYIVLVIVQDNTEVVL